MIRSGLKVPTPAIPMPDLAVPYAAPAHPNIIAAAIPPCIHARLSAERVRYRHLRARNVDIEQQKWQEEGPYHADERRELG
jgi:hypothetical protein